MRSINQKHKNTDNPERDRDAVIKSTLPAWYRLVGGMGLVKLYNGKYLDNEAQHIWALWHGCGEIVWCTAPSTVQYSLV